MKTPIRPEAGSAYLITLFALVVLTIMALSLALVTQTEVQIGSNERTVNRTFYSADSGLGIAVAQALVNSSSVEAASGTTTVLLNKTSVGGGASSSHLADRVTISSFVPIQYVRCDWCPANEGTQKFWRVNHAVSATAERIAWSGSDDPPAAATLLGQKTLSAMFQFEPWPTPSVESIPTDPKILAQIKF
jgi:Tfp pilus assembly protein PilX